MDHSFFSGVSQFKLADPSLRSDSDFADRLNFHYSTLLIVIFAVVISAKQYVGSPLHCWTPPEFNDQWQAYAENYCWIKNTYFVPMNDTKLPNGPAQRRQLEINYYQYVPFILALMALGFNLPKMVWKILNYRTGVDVEKTIEFSSSIIRADPADRDELVARLAADLKDKIAYQMDDKNRKAYMRGLKNFLSCFACRSINSFGSYLTISYLFTKVLYCLNSVGLLVAVSFMLHSSFRPFDPAIFREIFNSKSWHASGVFPRITFCDFLIRRHGYSTPYTIQCVLMINLFNEKIFAFLWFWFLALSAVNLSSVLFWLLYCLPIKQRSFIADYMQSNQRWTEEEIGDKLDDFVHTHLKNDGIFMLRLIASNSGHLVTTDLVHQLWDSRYISEKDADTESASV